MFYPKIHTISLLQNSYHQNPPKGKIEYIFVIEVERCHDANGLNCGEQLLQKFVGQLLAD